MKQAKSPNSGLIAPASRRIARAMANASNVTSIMPRKASNHDASGRDFQLHFGLFRKRNQEEK